jgi:hypothetical protein
MQDLLPNRRLLPAAILMGGDSNGRSGTHKIMHLSEPEEAKLMAEHSTEFTD